MPLQRGEVRGYDFNRMVVEFTMLDQGKVILCAISTAAMDDLEGRRDVKPEQRVDQFMKLRDVIEEKASWWLYALIVFAVAVVVIFIYFYKNGWEL